MPPQLWPDRPDRTYSVLSRNAQAVLQVGQGGEHVDDVVWVLGHAGWVRDLGGIGGRGRQGGMVRML